MKLETPFSLRVTGIEVLESGLMIVITDWEQDWNPILPGMEARVYDDNKRQWEFTVLDVMGPLLRDDGVFFAPAFKIKHNDPQLFSKKKEVDFFAGKTDERGFLLQSYDTWVMSRLSGIVVTGTAQDVISKGDTLELWTGNGEKSLCECVGFERFRDGSGRPTTPGEGGVSLLLRVAKELDYDEPENIMKWVGDFPSLHKPSGT